MQRINSNPRNLLLLASTQFLQAHQQQPTFVPIHVSSHANVLTTCGKTRKPEDKPSTGEAKTCIEQPSTSAPCGCGKILRLSTTTTKPYSSSFHPNRLCRSPEFFNMEWTDRSSLAQSASFSWSSTACTLSSLEVVDNRIVGFLSTTTSQFSAF